MWFGDLNHCPLQRSSLGFLGRKGPGEELKIQGEHGFVAGSVSQELRSCECQALLAEIFGSPAWSLACPWSKDLVANDGNLGSRLVNGHGFSQM